MHVCIPKIRDLPLQVSASVEMDKLFGLGTSDFEELPHTPSVKAMVK